jgi:hypothetical protein
MKNIFTFVGLRILIAGSLIVGAVGVAPRSVSQAQDEQDELRKIWDDNLVSVRPPATEQKQVSPSKETSQPRHQIPATRPRVRYRRMTPALPRITPPQRKARHSVKPDGQVVAARMEGRVNMQGRVLGVTFWRLRPSTPGDEARIFVHDPAQPGVKAWTPERIEAETPLAAGDRVRISIESPTAGYLYVVNHERYADGTTGTPELIFPTTRTRGGENRVEAGRVVEIPAQEDNPPYFTMRPSRPDQVAEELVVIVTEQRLELNIGREPLRLDREQLRVWIERWRVPVERLEQVGGRGRAWTRAEQEAGGELRKLTQDEPSPQTVYHANTRMGEPLLVTMALRYAGAAGRRRREK